MKTLPITLTLLAGLAACNPSGPDAEPSLSPFEDCQTLEKSMRKIATKEFRRAQAIGINVGFGFGMVDYVLYDMDKGSMNGGSLEVSTTNLEEQNVDEADVMKTDGTFLYTVVNALNDGIIGQEISVSRIWPVEEAQEITRISIEGVIDGLYLVKDHLIAISLINEWEQTAPRSGAAFDPMEHKVGTLVTMVDVGDPEHPEVIREAYLSGTLQSSRRVDDTLVLATETGSDLRWWDSGTVGREFKQIRNRTADAYVPWIVDSVRVDGEGWSTVSEPACGCDSVFASKRETGTNMSHIATFDLSDLGAPVKSIGVVGRTDTVYATTENIYLAYRETTEQPFQSRDDELNSVVHKIALGNAETGPSYQATGEVRGVLPPQFGMSEKDDVLRVATTVIDGNWDEWSSSVTTLAQVDDTLIELGSVHGLAPGEELFSSRFMGDLAYLVTYETVGRNSVVDPNFDWQQWRCYGGCDPLFTIDVSDPRAPKVLGELELTGWSDYLHPIADERLLSVGMDSDAEGNWFAAVSLFDVSELTEPLLQDRILLEMQQTEAQTDHHAFNYFPSMGTLALPNANALDVLTVNSDGLELLGTLDQTAMVADAGFESWSDDWNTQVCGGVSRSVFMKTDESEIVWAVSEMGLTAASPDALHAPIKEVPFAGVEAMCTWDERMMEF